MQEITLESAKERYKDLLENKDVREISSWIESNNSTPTDEKALVERAKLNAEMFFKKIDSAMKVNLPK
jgi:hypothetical protein